MPHVPIRSDGTFQYGFAEVEYLLGQNGVPWSINILETEPIGAYDGPIHESLPKWRIATEGRVPNDVGACREHVRFEFCFDRCDVRSLDSQAHWVFWIGDSR